MMNFQKFIPPAFTSRELWYSILFAVLLCAPILDHLISGNALIQMVQGDLFALYFPSFVQGYHLFNEGIFSGIDWATAGGSSDFFMRGNLPSNYPLYWLCYLLFDLSNTNVQLICFQSLIFVHVALSLYFSQLVLRLFGFGILAATLGSVVYTTGVILNPLNITLTPFYIIGSLFPMALYASLKGQSWSGPKQFMLLSLPPVLLLLGGYLPLSIQAIFLVGMFTVLYYFYVQKTPFTIESCMGLVRGSLPLIMGVLVVSPLYIAMFASHLTTSTMPDTVNIRAHDLALDLGNFFHAVSRVFPMPNHTEWPHVRFGFIPLFLLLAFILARLPAESEKVIRFKRLAEISLLIWLFFFAVTLGPFSGLTDIFYAIGWPLSSMHIYQRYLITSFFFFAVLVAMVAHRFLESGRADNIGPLAVGLVVILVVVMLLDTYGAQSLLSKINLGQLEVELLYLCAVAVPLAMRKMRWAIVTAIIGIMAVNTAWIYSASSHHHNINTFKDNVMFRADKSDRLHQFFKANTPPDKKIIKYADITDGILVEQGVPRNYPWIVFPKIKLSNYTGYELHVGRQKDYQRYSPWFGKLDLDWLEKTGVDFVIFDNESYEKNMPRINSMRNQDIGQLDLGDGFIVIAMTQMNSAYNNGVIRVEGEGVQVQSWQSNLFGNAEFTLSAASQHQVQMTFYPHPNLKFLVDGNVQEIPVVNGMYTLDLAPGKRHIEIKYSRPLLELFRIIELLYSILLAIIIVIPSRYISKLNLKGARSKKAM